MKRFLPIIIFFIVLQGCDSGIPKEIIQPDKMEKILFDVHVVDGYISTIANKDTAKIVASSYYKGVYKKFGIDSALYNQSMDYYYNHPDILEKIYAKVEKKFTVEKAKNDKVVAQETAVPNKYNQNGITYLEVNPLTIKPELRIDANPFSIDANLSRF